MNAVFHNVPFVTILTFKYFFKLQLFCSTSGGVWNSTGTVSRGASRRIPESFWWLHEEYERGKAV